MDVSNADRVVFPDDGITKGDVVAYYLGVAARLLPFVAGRALTVHRFPRGIDKPGFMQKNAPDHFSEELIRRHTVPKNDGGTTTYPVVDSMEAIAAFANLGVITFHVPPSTADDWEHPDWIIWDLDPPPGRVDLVREAAATIRALLEDFGVPTVLLASGSNGYHLRAPLRSGTTFDTTELVARGTAELAAGAYDATLTTAFRKAERKGRVFIDWMRNGPLATSVAPWSLRARAGAPVAAPLDWDELGDVAPDGVRLGTVADRLEGEVWAGAAPIDLAPTARSVQEALDAAGIELEPFDRFRS